MRDEAIHEKDSTTICPELSTVLAWWASACQQLPRLAEAPPRPPRTQRTASCAPASARSGQDPVRVLSWTSGTGTAGRCPPDARAEKRRVGLRSKRLALGFAWASGSRGLGVSKGAAERDAAEEFASPLRSSDEPRRRRAAIAADTYGDVEALAVSAKQTMKSGQALHRFTSVSESMLCDTIEDGIHSPRFSRMDAVCGGAGSLVSARAPPACEDTAQSTAGGRRPPVVPLRLEETGH